MAHQIPLRSVFPLAPEDGVIDTSGLEPPRPPRVTGRSAAWLAGGAVALPLSQYVAYELNAMGLGLLAAVAIGVVVARGVMAEYIASTGIVPQPSSGIAVLDGLLVLATRSVQPAAVATNSDASTPPALRKWALARGLQVRADLDASTVLVGSAASALPAFRGMEANAAGMATGLVGHRGMPIHVAKLHWVVTEQNLRIEAPNRVWSAWVVLCRLPKGVAAMYPCSSLSRPARPVRGLSIQIPGAFRVRSESVDFDRTCTLRIVGDPDGLQWRELLHPAFLSELAHERDITWQQQGEWLAIIANADASETVPVRRLDTMCANALWLHEQFVRAAYGDVPGRSLTQDTPDAA